MTDQELRAIVLFAVKKERERQIAKRGKQRMSYGRWLKILVEEVGEVAEAMQKDEEWAKDSDSNNLFEECIHAAAVSLSIAEQVLEEELKQYV
ncbi:hypothetical protein [Fictibacillus sp. NRS-1165]|uniref:hypothetical protein n=1 Tax=Fictibacillus sp. NRS-1165 TaxID=3144463 RepID=UPI003D1DF0F0